MNTSTKLWLTAAALGLASLSFNASFGQPGPSRQPMGMGGGKMGQNLPANFHMTTLANGLQVLVIQDPVVPLVTIELVVKNGSYTEDTAFNGLSHLYEHMFFKANKDYPSQEAYLKRVNELGIVFNGTTSQERVNYYVTLGKGKLKDGLQFMNSAIRYPLFLEEEMRKENVVVAGEFQRNESNPIFSLSDQMNHELWGDLYCRKNVIGDYNVIYTATPAKMKTVQAKYYYPNNSILVVAGDANPQEVFKMAEEIYGSWEKANFDPFQKFPVPEFQPLTETRQFVVESDNARIPIFMMSWHGPDTRKDLAATYAADVFHTAVSLEASKFQQSLVESGLALQIQNGYQTAKHTGAIQMIVVPNPMKIKECLETVRAQMAMWDDPNYLTDEQIATAKSTLAAQDAYSKESPSEYVHTVTYWWASATIDYYTNYINNLNRVTKADIARYVQRYVKDKPHVEGVLTSAEMRAQLGLDKVFAATPDMTKLPMLEFGKDKAEISEEDKAKLAPLAQYLAANPKRNIGLAANQGKKEPAGIAQARLEAVKKALMEMGVKPSQISSTSTNTATVKSKDEAVLKQFRTVTISTQQPTSLVPSININN